MKGAIAEGGRITVDNTLTESVSIEHDSPISTAFSEKRPVSGDNQIAVPILFNEDAMGVIWVAGTEDAAATLGLAEENLRDALWRLSSDSALVLNSARLSAELETGDIDVPDLLNLDADG